ncbi:hypothetical protein BJ170DRAFT_706243 [Xylariales sp. AK1849]|nr:hypothetical protein BJ170DRAFT_706243 [Xylariales sp. AK1849]
MGSETLDALGNKKKAPRQARLLLSARNDARKGRQPTFSEIMDACRVVSASDFDLGIRKWRVFSKTKSGCLTCKSKKVKCDEAKPSCARCRRNRWSCVYGSDSNHNHCSKTPSPGSHLTNKSRDGTFSVLSSVTLIPFSSPSAKNGTPSLYLIQHCHKYWTEIFNIAYSDEVLSLFKSSVLVRNVILAIVACHLRHLTLGDVQHRIAEHYQQSLAIQDYRKSLTTPLRELGQSGVNELLLGATLLGVLAFPLPSSESGCGGGPHSSTSFIFSTRHDRLGWLTFQAGVRPLIRSMEPCFENSMNFLGHIFLSPRERSWLAPKHGLEEVPERWARFFGLIDTADFVSEQMSRDSVLNGNNRANVRVLPLRDVFRAPVITAAHLGNVEPIPINAFLHISFLSKTHHEFRNLLYERDERALWLYGYWFGLMCRFEGLWWSQQRATRDYEAILLWLQQLRLTKRLGLEGALWREMMTELELAPNLVHRSRGSTPGNTEVGETWDDIWPRGYQYFGVEGVGRD